MKKSRLLSVLLCLALLSGLLATFASAADSGSAILDEMDVNAKAAVLVDPDTGEILYEKNAHAHNYPASITKVMTCLLTLEAVDRGELSLEQTVTASSALHTGIGEGASTADIKEGEQIRIIDLLYAALIPSANEACNVMAEAVSGDVASFVELMNTRAAELGMEDTHFVNCTGLPAPGHLTSAYDIALMSRQLLLHHPDIRQYTTIWTDSIRNGAFGLTNTNRLIRFYDGATGLKTGFTASAQYCMSAAAQRNGMELIAVVMKAPTTAQRFQDASCLLDYGFANYALLTPQPEGPLAPIDVLLGQSKTVQPQLQRECRLLVEKAQADQITTRVDLARDVQAPVDPGQTLGEFQVYVGEQLRDTVPIVAAQGVERLSVPGLFSQLLRRLLFAG